VISSPICAWNPRCSVRCLIVSHRVYREESTGQTTAIARLKAGHYPSVSAHRQFVPQSIAFNFRIVHNTTCLFVPEVCDAVVMEFENDVFVTPSTPDSWKEVAGNFGFCYRTVIVRSSCGAHTIDITPCGARPVPEQEPHGRRMVSIGAPCGLFTSAVRYDPGISHGRRMAS